MVIDAYSWRPSSCALAPTSCYALSAPQPKWLEEIVTSYEVDIYTMDIIAKLVVDI
jgi:hypothetical protein